MVPTLTLEIAKTQRFSLGCALYGFSDDSLLRACQILVHNPVVGRPYIDNVALWSWQFGEFDLIYAISGDFSKLVLLELRPLVENPGSTIERMFSAIDRINAIKRLFGV